MSGMNMVLLAGHVPCQAHPSLRHCIQAVYLATIQLFTGRTRFTTSGAHDVIAILHHRILTFVSKSFVV